MATNIARAVLRTVIATGAFAAVHSLLASRAAKRSAATYLGARNADGLYRVAYIAQSFATAGLLVKYLKSQPVVELYHVRGPAAVLMHGVQIAGLVHATLGARQVGILRITGLENFAAWLGGEDVPPMPEAQGPGFTDESADRALGPFASSRHPLNLSPLPILWLWPRMNSTLLAFNAAATAYVVLGSIHEEARLLEVDREDYEEYQSSGVPFYWPAPSREASETIRDLRQEASFYDAT